MGLGEVEREYVLVDVEQAGEHYTYVAWSGEGDAVFRA